MMVTEGAIFHICFGLVLKITLTGFPELSEMAIGAPLEVAVTLGLPIADQHSGEVPSHAVVGTL